jgi:hypothetical protein
MARWAKSTSATGKVKEALDHILDDGLEEAVISLETGLIFGQELVKVMEEHPVEHGAFRMSGTVTSCHSRDS